MEDNRISKLANVLVNYSTEVKPGDWVVITGPVLSLPLFNKVYEKVILAGGNPTTLLLDDSFLESKYLFSDSQQLDWVSPLTELIYEKADVMIHLQASTNTRFLSNVDPEKQQRVAIAHKDITSTYMHRSATKDLRWVLTNYPCNSFAQDADMSLRDYTDFVYQATFADLDDPIAEWKKIHNEQKALVEWLDGKKVVKIKGPNVDLTLSIEGRSFLNADGKQNMPSGEIYTSPVEESASGWIKFSYPAITGGREVEGVSLVFEDGRVVTAKAEKNEDYLLSMLDTDENARFLGEFAIGTNFAIEKFTKNILYDEKLGGTIHLAVGNGFPEVGGKNVSSIHWDMICDMRDESEIFVDDELFYKNGQFMVYPAG